MKKQSYSTPNLDMEHDEQKPTNNIAKKRRSVYDRTHYKIENCADLQRGWRKTLSQYVCMPSAYDTKLENIFEN